MTADPTSSPEAGPADDASALPDRIAFLGFGLIGGSIAKALRAAGVRSELVAWTPGGRGPDEGLRAGVLDRAADSAAAALDGAGLVVLAGPATAVLATVEDLGGSLASALDDGATVTDVASTKGLIVEAAAARRLPFVGGHPMAGIEASGFPAADAELFGGRPWVVVPAASATPRDVARVEALVRLVGARPMHTSATAHDDAVAAISHLPLVLAAALVEAVIGASGMDANHAAEWALARELAAGGWASMTRLALGDPAMGAAILATNAGPVADRLRDLRLAIDAWIELLEGGAIAPDEAALAERLAAARAALSREGRA